MTSRATLWAAMMTWLLALALIGCAKQEEVIIETAAGKGLTADDIDTDPWSLLPSGAVTWAYTDAEQLFASPVGQKVLSLIERRSPIPASAGFVPKRDLKRLHVGFYSMQGVDFAGVASGAFDREKIEKAAAATDKTPLGVPVTQTRYAERTVYMAGDVGFVVLTAHTALFGNQIGIRRALDRIQQGRIERPLPKWLETMLKTPNAPMVIGVDLTSNPLSAAARQQFAFLDGLRTARMLGNFEDPGLNFAGTLTYADPAAAERGAENLRRIDQTIQSYGWLMALLGIAQPLRKLEAKPKGDEAQFVVAVDGQAVNVLLDRADAMLPVPQSTAPQSTAPQSTAPQSSSTSSQP